MAATNPDQPAWMPAALRPGAFAFALLFTIESISRASIISVVPIQAYDLLQDKQHVSVFYFVIGAFGMAATLCAPLAFQRYHRRHVYTAGALLLVAACGFLATHTLAGQAIGQFLRILAASTVAITLNLYIMETIPKQGLVRSESLRLTLGTLAWTLGPSFGVWLYVRYGYVAPYLWSAAWALILIALFWWMRLSAAQMRPARVRTVSPIAGIRRFMGQPRLRLGWLIAFGRSCYWMTFYVYAPILMVVTGQGKLAGGLIVSAASALLLFSMLWGRLGARIGVRRVVVMAFVGASLAALAAGWFGESYPWVAALLLLAGINFAVALDAVGNVPFLRAVHPYERPEMTAVYRTNLDLSDLLPALVYSVILGFTGLGGVFVALGLFSAFCAWMSWKHLPRTM